MSSRSLLIAPVLSLALFVPGLTPVHAGSAATGDSLLGSSSNMTHVANLPHRVRSVDGGTGAGGSDIEFVTLNVQRVDASGNTIVEERDFALAGTYSNGLQIIDITDPRNPTTASVYDCVIQQGDVQVFERAGRTYVGYSMDEGYGTPGTSSDCYREARALGLRPPGTTNFGTFIADITDPYAPKTVSFVAESRGSHNATISPNGAYLYNSNSDLGAGNPQIEVWDIRNFAAPSKVFTLNTTTGLSSHDITFNESGTRAYSAAITHTLILDTTNLAAPTIIGRIVDPAINIHHQSDPITIRDATTGLDHTFLVVTDEIAGATGLGHCPGGGLHVYDVTGHLERAPVKVGFWNMPEARKTPGLADTCTSHVLRFYPEEKLMTIAWYNGGVRVVDVSGLVGVSVGADEVAGNVGVGMKEVGYAYFDNSDTWSAKTNRIEADGSFYLYGNDLARGLDVYRFEAAAPPAANGGIWLTPGMEPQASRSAAGPAGPRCLYLAKELRVG